MMLKANGEYLDFSGDIEIERQSKLFEAFSETLGDFAYAFDLDDTATNRRILKLDSLNRTDKIIYQSIDAEIQNDSGVGIYYGLLRVERYTNVITCGFFSGNNNWITQLTGNLLDINWDDLDVEKTSTAVTDTWNASQDGVIFPLVDKGGLEDRLGQALANDTRNLNLNVFDFHPFYFVNKILTKVIQNAGLKISGELLEDPIYKNLIITSNRGDTRSERIDSRTSEVGRNTSQSLPTSRTKLQLTSADPFSDGELELWNNTLFRYVADVAMTIKIVNDLNTSVDQVYLYEIEVNGSVERSWEFANENTYTTTLDLSAGDYVDFYVTSMTSTANLLSGSSITIYPLLFEYFYASDYIPSMDKATFVKNVFNLFNVVVNYNPFTKTLDTRLFKNIKNQPEIDISEHVSSIEVDYYEFIESFAKINNFKYTVPEITEIEDYNKANPKEYGAGTIELQNKYLQETADVLELEFAPPFTYYNNNFRANLAKINYANYSRINDTEFDISSVSNSGGIARFNVTGAMPLGILVGRIVEIFNSSNSAYEGTGILSVVTGTYFELVNVAFINTATANFNLVTSDPIESDTPIIMVSSFLNVNEFSGFDTIYVGSNPFTEVPYGWFDKPSTGLVTDNMVNSLSFDPVNQLNSYQTGLIDNYYGDFKRILNDPVKIYATCNLPEKVFKQITFTELIRLRFRDFDCQFYGNKISGFKNSFTPCIFELIKRNG